MGRGQRVGTFVGTHVGMHGLAPVGSPAYGTRIVLICPLLYEAYKRIQERTYQLIS